MQPDRETLDAFNKLRMEPYWPVIRGFIEKERVALVDALVNGGAESEFERGQIAGRVQFIDKLCETAETAPQSLKNFHTR